MAHQPYHAAFSLAAAIVRRVARRHGAMSDPGKPDERKADDRPVNNALEDALNNGECAISGVLRLLKVI
jgi:hypothetical protein